MSDWNPTLYRRFEEERTRPAQELLARVPLAQARSVVDLGCGPGNSTQLLVQRFPQAEVVGIDNSRTMLEEARQRLPHARFEFDDISDWEPEQPPDLIFANAALQWVPDHSQLLPRLFSLLAPGGVLAVQMPDNLEEATHRLMREVASDPPWSAAMGPALAARTPLLSIGAYYDLLAGEAQQVDTWRTAFQHPMESPGAIVDWLRSTGLRPFIDCLPEASQPAFLSAYERRLADAYPSRSDGRRLLAFPRLFIVAQRRP